MVWQHFKIIWHSEFDLHSQGIRKREDNIEEWSRLGLLGDSLRAAKVRKREEGVDVVYCVLTTIKVKELT